MRSLIILSLVVVCAALSQARHLRSEVVSEVASQLADEKDKGSHSHSQKVDEKEKGDKHDHSKEHDIEDRHEHSKEEHEHKHEHEHEHEHEHKHEHEHERERGEEIADSSEDPDFSEKDYVAIIAIIIDPETRRARLLSHELPTAAVAALD